MTNKEHLIALICEKLPGVSVETITTLFNIVNERDWAVFCSYMDDVDHPEERTAANEKMNKKIDELVLQNADIKSVAETIINELDNKHNTTNVGDFYYKEFHNMEKEYVS